MNKKLLQENIMILPYVMNGKLRKSFNELKDVTFIFEEEINQSTMRYYVANKIYNNISVRITDENDKTIITIDFNNKHFRITQTPNGQYTCIDGGGQKTIRTLLVWLYSIDLKN